MLTKFAEIAGILTLVVTVYAFLESSNRLPEQMKLPAPIQPETYFYIIVFLLAATLLGSMLSASQNTARLEKAAQNPKPDPSLSEMAKVVIELLNATKAIPQQVAEPYTTFSKAQAETVNSLGLLRHTGWKRYLEWIANYPNAADNAEKWRLAVIEILKANYGEAVVTRFNTPTTRESERTGWLIRAQEHAFRVDRLGEILDDIVKGKIPAGLGLAH